MPTHQDEQAVSLDFIRLLFKPRIEEEIAHRWAMRLGAILGPQAEQLRPETILAEMLKWAALSSVSSVRFLLVFEPELRMDFAAFLDHADQVTFREMVQHYAARFEGCD